jgi:hypothetical protein
MTPAQAKAATETPLRPGEIKLKGFEDYLIHTQAHAKASGFQSVTTGYSYTERHMILKACSNFILGGRADYILVQGEEAHKVEIWRPKNKVK